ncbi:GNAT family N-acetyltransferase [Shewanella intestini]|uniref:GNAT family N-acetyltransferase n=1 Tax=Shewanella intestini TaxID=2017544 RepID=A0ABS5HYY9_9GAMM|nr:GNAT family N-acetyltransferase [Shewanella intestini]MRG35808.1 GNAT family N-acetyltransferase [Shewanella sp. XMDDZSB0408]
METARLQLIPPSLEYQPRILAAIQESEQELTTYLSWVPYALTQAESIADTQLAISNFTNATDELRFSIINKQTAELIGAIGLIIRDNSVPFYELGYWIRTSSAGHGFMTEAVTAIEHYAFSKLNAVRLEIRAAQTNHKSWAIAKRCGYEFEGTLINERRLPSGELDNTLVYSKTQQPQR